MRGESVLNRTPFGGWPVGLGGEADSTGHSRYVVFIDGIEAFRGPEHVARQYAQGVRARDRRAVIWIETEEAG